MSTSMSSCISTCSESSTFSRIIPSWFLSHLERDLYHGALLIFFSTSDADLSK